MSHDHSSRGSWRISRCSPSHADAGDGRQSGADVLRLGRGRVCSYLLIGFWYTSPAQRGGDQGVSWSTGSATFGFALGIFGTSAVRHGLRTIFSAVPQSEAGCSSWLDYHAMTSLPAAVHRGHGQIGAAGLHTWLPDAMEGPTPVSALIHAATMVTAGVSWSAACRRCSNTRDSADGRHDRRCLDRVLRGDRRLTQNDIKRVIAYSTCSQLGYMFFAAAFRPIGAAMFHLFTHAFFKALLFLGAAR